MNDGIRLGSVQKLLERRVRKGGQGETFRYYFRTLRFGQETVRRFMRIRRVLRQGMKHVFLQRMNGVRLFGEIVFRIREENCRIAMDSHGAVVDFFIGFHDGILREGQG